MSKKNEDILMEKLFNLIKKLDDKFDQKMKENPELFLPEGDYAAVLPLSLIEDMEDFIGERIIFLGIC